MSLSEAKVVCYNTPRFLLLWESLRPAVCLGARDLIMKIVYKKLWKLLIDKEMMKKDLQKESGISWATLTKMSKGEIVSTEILMRVCETLHCDVGDIVEFIEDNNEKSEKQN